MAKKIPQRESMDPEANLNDVATDPATMPDEVASSTEGQGRGVPDPKLTADPLLREVQSFLDQRTALAKKLAEEISATERKLADLKKTAAMLFPEGQGSGESAKDRKQQKKLKSKSTARSEKSEPENLPAST